MNRLIYASEQYENKSIDLTDELRIHFKINENYFKQFKTSSESRNCFKLSCEESDIRIETNYFIGVDWIITDKVSLYIEPKLNDEVREIDFLNMLMDSLNAPENFNHLDDLFDIKYEESWIPIPQKKDILSPVLIVQFLKLLQHIVKKGLKKSYYNVQANLNGKVKGKILVASQIKENILKNKYTHTICQYQEFGVNYTENQYLKEVMSFVKTYICQSNNYFTNEQKKNLLNILNYCAPPFEQVEGLKNKHVKIKVKRNVFYKDYEEATRIGELILKRFSYNISKAGVVAVTTPPFWIDMSKLFELYVFKKLKEIFPISGEVTYHDRFLGKKETDILIRAENFQSVVDCKYKPRYIDNNPSLEDKRQLAGYTRLNSVYDKLKIPYNEIVKGLIIYSHQSFKSDISKEDLYKRPIKEYVDFYKLGISLPEVVR